MSLASKMGASAMGASGVAPLAAGERIGTLDVLRGVAVCGILLMNIPFMGLLWNSAGPDYPAVANADWIAFTIQRVGFEGAMRGLFTLLFGAGMAVMLRHAPQDAAGATSPAGQAYLTRCFGLMLLGVAQFALFLWPGEILFNYGVCGLALLLFRRADIRLLLTAAAALLIAISVSFGEGNLNQSEMLRTAAAADQAQAAKQKLTKEQTEALEARAEVMRNVHVPADVRAKERAERTSFPGVLAWSTKEWVKFNFREGVLETLAESLAFMLIGVALYRMKVLTGERSLKLYAAMAAVGFGLGLAVRGFRLAWQWQVGFEPDAGLWSWGGLVYEFPRLMLTLGFVGLVVMLYKLGALKWLAGGLKAIGRLALTNYIGQSVITSVLFYGLGWFDRFGFAALMGICVAVWIAQGVFSVLWLKRWEMGPAEWLLRSLTYGKLKPLGRTRPTAAAPAE
jgi:uncharacterized protein